MDISVLADKIKEAVIGEIRQEFKEFRAEVRGELSGFRLAIEAMSKRMDGIERRMDGIKSRMGELETKTDLPGSQTGILLENT